MVSDPQKIHTCCAVKDANIICATKFQDCPYKKKMTTLIVVVQTPKMNYIFLTSHSCGDANDNCSLFEANAEEGQCCYTAAQPLKEKVWVDSWVDKV